MPTPTPIDFFPTKGEPFERKAVAKPAEPIGQPQATEAEVVKEADRLLLGRYAPASVIVNADMDIVQFRGRSGVFLEPAPGRASLNVLHMAKEGLMMDLHSALTESKKRSIAVRREGISIKSDNRKLSVSLEVTPLQASGLFLVTFEETTLQPPSLTQEKARLSEREKQAGLLNREVARLERELASTKDYLQSIIEDKEAANEELKAANEEIQSSNEELQSTNEELETAKEELQSTNEELTTVNEELQNRNLELGQINDDLNAFLTSINLPVLILGSDLRIRRTTPQADKLLGLAPTDAGRSLADLKLNINAPTLMAHVAEVMDNMSPRDMDITDNQGHWWSKWIRPYRTSDNKIEGVVITFVDIDRLKRVEESLRTYTGNLQQLVDERTAQLEDRARLSTIGETAAMVGHDLRNPLQAMANTLYLANEKAKTMNDQSLASYLDSIGQQAGYMNRIVTDLQDYSKPVAPMFTNVNLGELVGETLSSVTIPDRIKVVRDFEPHLETVEADPNLLRRVFTNIVANALQAMPSGQGRLSISTSRKGEMALITVQDTGEGMSKETLSKLFNPLFTTKARGTGLGLPIAKRLVEAHEGTVNATSEPGKGATFEILLPIKQSRRSPDETRTSGSI